MDPENLVKLLEIVVSAQSDVDAVTQICQTASTNLQAAAVAIEAALSSGGGVPVDTSALVAAGQALVPAVNTIVGLAPPVSPSPVGG